MRLLAFARFLLDFAKLGEDETRFLLSVNAISVLVDFYLRAIRQSAEVVTMVRNEKRQFPRKV